MALVVGKSYQTEKGKNLGKYIRHEMVGFSTGGPEFNYVFEHDKLYDPNDSDRDELKKLKITEIPYKSIMEMSGDSNGESPPAIKMVENKGGVKKRSRKSRRKHRRTLKKYKKTKSRK